MPPTSSKHADERGSKYGGSRSDDWWSSKDAIDMQRNTWRAYEEEQWKRYEEEWKGRSGTDGWHQWGGDPASWWGGAGYGKARPYKDAKTGVPYPSRDDDSMSDCSKLSGRSSVRVSRGQNRGKDSMSGASSNGSFILEGTTATSKGGGHGKGGEVAAAPLAVLVAGPVGVIQHLLVVRVLGGLREMKEWVSLIPRAWELRALMAPRVKNGPCRTMVITSR